MPRFFKFTNEHFAPHFAFCEVPDGVHPSERGVPCDEHGNVTAEEVDRLPGDFETHVNGKWVKDEEGHKLHKEDARLRGMRPHERQEEAIQKAVVHLEKAYGLSKKQN